MYIRTVLGVSQQELDTMTKGDRAIISLLLDTGIRASELCSLTLDNVFLNLNEAHLKVYGKWSKWHEVGMGKQARTILHRYLTRHHRALKQDHHAFLTPYSSTLTLS